MNERLILGLTFPLVFSICLILGAASGSKVSAQQGCTSTSYEETSGGCWNNEIVSVCGGITCTATQGYCSDENGPYVYWRTTPACTNV